MVRFVRFLILTIGLLLPAGAVRGEAVDSLPAPTGHVNDFAGVLSPDTKQSVEQLCTQVDRRAHAQIAVVTIKTIDPDKSGAVPSIEEFAVKLEEKWGVGTKGSDRGVLMLLVMSPRRGRIEVGYGLEGILNDAKVGDIGRAMSPYAQKNDYDSAVRLGVGQLAGVIAADAGVSLDTGDGAQQYHWQRTQQPVHRPMSLVKVVVSVGVVLLIVIVLASTGNLGLVFWLLLNMMGSGGGGRGGGRDDDGGGFGGFGGGKSGGGGASGDF